MSKEVYEEIGDDLIVHFCVRQKLEPAGQVKRAVCREIDSASHELCQKYSCKLMTPAVKRTERRHHSKILSCNFEAGQAT